MTEQSYLDTPFVYRAGDRPPLKQPRMLGVIWGLGWVWTGTGSSIEHLIVIAPGYKARCISANPGSLDINKYTFESLPKREAAVELRQILTFLEQERLSEKEVKGWMLSDDHPVGFCWGIGQTLDITFDKEEKRIIEEFILEKIQQFMEE